MVTVMYLLAIINLQFSRLYLRRLAWVLQIQPVTSVEGRICEAPARSVVQGCSVHAMQTFFAVARQRSFCMLLSSSGGSRVSVAS